MIHKVIVYFKNVGVNTEFDFDNKKDAKAAYKELVEAADSGDSWVYETADRSVYINGEEIVNITRITVPKEAMQPVDPRTGKPVEQLTPPRDIKGKPQQ